MYPLLICASTVTMLSRSTGSGERAEAAILIHIEKGVIRLC
jgi:hypothetical protein